MTTFTFQPKWSKKFRQRFQLLFITGSWDFNPLLIKVWHMMGLIFIKFDINFLWYVYFLYFVYSLQRGGMTSNKLLVYVLFLLSNTGLKPCWNLKEPAFVLTSVRKSYGLFEFQISFRPFLCVKAKSSFRNVSPLSGTLSDDHLNDV